jgi:catechol 2,3-dioxygenase-like lactoylglutathione lyase family enzyme
MTVSGFWHGGVTVSSMDRSLRFYCEQLGLTQLTDRVVREPALLEVVAASSSGIRICMLQIPGSDTYLELLEYVDGAASGGRIEVTSPGNGHLCFYVQDLRSLWARLQEAGVRPISPGPVDCSARISGTWCMYISDPDGYAIELFEGPAYPAGRRTGDWVATDRPVSEEES